MPADSVVRGHMDGCLFTEMTQPSEKAFPGGWIMAHECIIIHSTLAGDARNGYPGTRVSESLPATRLLAGYPGTLVCHITRN